MARDLPRAHGAPTAWPAGRSRLRYPERAGYWPAAAGLFAFVWLELASPDPGSLGAIKTWLLVYLAVTMAGALCCGDRWCARADPFEVYSMVASRLSALRRNRDGRIAIGNPFDHLPSLPVRAGTVAVLAVLLGSTVFDSFSATPQWRGFVDGPHGLGRYGDAAPHRGAAGVRRRGRGHVLARGARHRRRRPHSVAANCPG